MATKLLEKLKIGKSKEEEKRQTKRGVAADKDELKKWIGLAEFTQLDSKGQEAFFRYLEKLNGDHKYPDENKGVLEVTATSLNARRYQFWLKNKDVNLPLLFDLFDMFLNVKDDDKNILGTDVSKEVIDKKKTDAENVHKFFEEIKDKLKPGLNTQFTNFKKELEEDDDIKKKYIA